MDEKKRRRIVLVIAGVLAAAATIHYLLYVQPPQRIGPIGLQRLTLLNLDEPAPNLEFLGVGSLPAVVVFCEGCALPTDIDGEIMKTSDPAIARRYGLISPDGSVGPGYAIIDAGGNVRYVTFDKELHKHSGEINRILRGTE